MSIATLTIRRPRPLSEEEEADQVFERLRALKVSAGTNRNDLAIVLITACIKEGWNTRPRIVGALRQLEFDTRHAVIILNSGTGPDPARHYWRRDENGIYHLLNDPT